MTVTPKISGKVDRGFSNMIAAFFTINTFIAQPLIAPAKARGK